MIGYVDKLFSKFEKREWESLIQEKCVKDDCISEEVCWGVDES